MNFDIETILHSLKAVLPYVTPGIIVGLVVGATRIWRYRRRRPFRQLIGDLLSESKRLIAQEEGIEIGSRIFPNPNSVTAKIERLVGDRLFARAKPIMNRAKLDGGPALRNRVVDAIALAGEAGLSPSQIISLANRPQKLTELYLNNIRVKLKDDDLFRRVEPLMADVYKLVLDDGRFIDELVKHKSLSAEAGYSIDVDSETHTRAPVHLKENRANLTYDLRADDFVGRRDLVDHLVTNFLDVGTPADEARHFRWTLIYGRAGSGKSRFAVELLRDERLTHHFTISGFVGQRRESSSKRFNEENAERWYNSGPTLFVLDYASHHSNLPAVMRALDKKAKDSGQFLRLLLLERLNDDVWTSLIRGGGGSDASLRDSRYEVNGDLFGLVGHELRTTDEVYLGAITVAQALEITKKRIVAERPLGLHETDEFLRRELEALDPFYRPLFAAMVGGHLGASSPLSEEEASSAEARKERSEQMLADLIKRERNNFWLRPGEYADEDAPRRHEMLLALSTMCRGVPRRVIRDEKWSALIQLPSQQTFETDRYRRMISNPEATTLGESGPFGFLMPDFIGEWFVLETFCNRLAPEDRDAFVQCAWSCSDGRVMTFIRQCHQNRHDRVADLGFFLPKPGEYRTQVVGMLHLLIGEMCAFATFAWKEGTSNTDKQAKIAGHLITLFEALQKHVPRGTKLTTEEAFKVADASARLSYALAFFFSPTVRDSDNTPKIVIPPSEHETQDRIRDRLSLSFAISQRISSAFQKSAMEQDPNHLSEQVIRALSTYTALASVQEETSERTSLADLAGRLLRDAATFFRSLAEANAPIREQMEENAKVYYQIGDLVEDNPLEEIESGEARHFELAVRLLNDAADFFATIGEQNPPLAEQMQENSSVFNQLATMLAQSPNGYLQPSNDIADGDTPQSGSLDSSAWSGEALLKNISKLLQWTEQAIGAPWCDDAVGPGYPSAIAALLEGWRYAIDFAGDVGGFNKAKRMASRVLESLHEKGIDERGMLVAASRIATRMARLVTLRACELNKETSESGHTESSKGSQLARHAETLAVKWASFVRASRDFENDADAIDAWADNYSIAAWALRGTDGPRVWELLHELHDVSSNSIGTKNIPLAAGFAIDTLVGYTVTGAIRYDPDNPYLAPDQATKIWLMAQDLFRPSSPNIDGKGIVRGIGALGRLIPFLPDEEARNALDLIGRLFERWDRDQSSTDRNAPWALHEASSALAHATGRTDKEVVRMAHYLLPRLFGDQRIPDINVEYFFPMIGMGQMRISDPPDAAWVPILKRGHQALLSAIEKDDSDNATKMAIVIRAAAEKWSRTSVATAWQTMEGLRKLHLFWLHGLVRRMDFEFPIEAYGDTHMREGVAMFLNGALGKEKIDHQKWTDAVSSLLMEVVVDGHFEDIDKMLTLLWSDPRIPGEVGCQALMIACTGAASLAPNMLAKWADWFVDMSPDEFATEDGALAFSHCGSALVFECASLYPEKADRIIDRLTDLSDSRS